MSYFDDHYWGDHSITGRSLYEKDEETEDPIISSLNRIIALQDETNSRLERLYLDLKELQQQTEGVLRDEKKRD
jgi:hypothetical protein